MSHYKKALLRNWTTGNSDEEDIREERSRGEPEKSATSREECKNNIANGALRGTRRVIEIEDDDLEFPTTEQTPNALDEPMQDISETIDARPEDFGESQPISRPVVCSRLQNQG